MKTEKLLFGVAVVLAVFSLINIQWEILPNRWLRIFTSGIVFLFAIKIIGLKKLAGLLIFGFFIVCDFLLLEWENVFAKHAYYFLHSLIILSLMLLTIREMNWDKISSYEIGTAILFLIFCSIIFLALKEFFSIDDILLKILFNIHGFLLVSLVVLAFFNSIANYNYLASSFLVGILSLAVSELILVFIYFLEAFEFRYIDNFFYVAGLFSFLKVSLENKLLKESNLELEEKKDVKESNQDGDYI